MVDQQPAAVAAAAGYEPAAHDVRPVTGLAAEGWVQLKNEFAASLVRVDTTTTNGPVLQIADPATGRSIALDPLELSALAWCRHDQLKRLLEPAFKEQRLDDGDFPSDDPDDTSKGEAQ